MLCKMASVTFIELCTLGKCIKKSVNVDNPKGIGFRVHEYTIHSGTVV